MEKTPRNFILLSILAFVIMSLAGLSLIPMVNAAYSSESSLVGFGLTIASCVFGFSGGYSIAKIGVAAVSALTEKPETFGKSFLFIVFAEAVAIYGLVLGFLVYFGL
ncbi:MAG: ATP synthase subunit C [Candidatus Helarchaeota archaeon]